MKYFCTVTAFVSYVIRDKGRRVYEMSRKEELPFMPFIGLGLTWDRADDPWLVAHVNYDLVERWTYVELADEDCDPEMSEEDVERAIQNFRADGWTVSTI